MPGQFDIVFDQSIEVNSIIIHTPSSNVFEATLMAWDSIQSKFIKLTAFRATDSGPFADAFGDACFPKTRSNKFRLVMNPGPVVELYMNGGYRINNWIPKSGIGIYDLVKPANEFMTYNNAVKEDIIPMNRILDLTDKLQQNGKLNWKVPEGEWTVLRIGYTSNGVKIYPAPNGGDGLECDKLSKEGTLFNYNHAIKPILEKLGSELSKTVESQHIDSYEAGWQNWTEKFADEFKNRCNYDILKFLPAVTGRVVESEETTEKFLWDFRHTISDLFIDNHFGGAAKAGRADGLLFSNEPYNVPFNGLKAGGVSDYPMIEFWFPDTQPLENRMRFHPVFAGRVNGRKVIGAEAFTSGAPAVRWNEHPYLLKATGDYIYCSGVNRFTMHVSTHQAFMGEHSAPGLTISDLGIHFDRYNTWWEHGAKEYVSYLTRCQSILQQGEHRADVLYFIGSETPFNDTWHSNWGLKKYEPELPYGYDFDACSEDVLVKLNVRNKQIELPFGKNYNYLVLPAHGWITTELLKKILSMVNDGATIIGSPVGASSPGLSDEMRNSQNERKNIILELWGKNPDIKGERRVGNGRIIWGSDFQTILSHDKLIPDFEYSTSAGLLINSIHRYTGNEEIYFVANGKQQAGWATCRFRVMDKEPQFWDPYDGKIKPCRMHRTTGEHTEIPIYFDASGSLFVIFKKQDQRGNGIVSITQNGIDITRKGNLSIEFSGNENKVLIWEPGKYQITKEDGKSRIISSENVPGSIEFTRPWNLTFPKGWGAPLKVEFPKLISYPEHPNEGIKYFSGTAVYQTTVNIPHNVIGKNRAIYLDLGRVEVIARVKLNGKKLGTFWKPPFRMDVSPAIIAGENRLEVTVTNLWPNRLIGDEQYPSDVPSPDNELPSWVLENKQRPEQRRMTFTTSPSWKKGEALLPSGLLGPVSLKIADIVYVK